MKKFSLAMGHNTNFDATLTTVEGFELPIQCTNVAGFTYFAGNGWKEFARVYTLEVGQEIVFNMDTNDEELRVITETWPITHPSNLQFSSMSYYFSYFVRYTFNCLCYTFCSILQDV